MQNLFLGLHTAMVPVILAVGALALICGIALLVMKRAGSA